MLPQDGHVHSQFSWDATFGDMRATCARAVVIGLNSLAFTEHVDPRPWAKEGHAIPDNYRGQVDDHGRFLADPLDIAAYLEEIDRCRTEFPDLRILSGVELSEPHHYPDAVPGLLAAAGCEIHGVDRVIGSVHSLLDLSLDLDNDTGNDNDTGSPGSEWVEVPDAYAQRRPVEVVRAYLDEVSTMAASNAPFAVLGHIDYPLRAWPADAGPVPWADLEDAFRGALRTLADSGRALEVNTRLPLSPVVVTWWHQAGGQAVVFGSDAHPPTFSLTTSPRPPRWSRRTASARGQLPTNTGVEPDRTPYRSRRVAPGRRIADPATDLAVRSRAGDGGPVTDDLAVDPSVFDAAQPIDNRTPPIDDSTTPIDDYVGDPAVQAEWDRRYGDSEQLWSGRPNAALVAEVAALTPGRVLDVGCGEGADAVWLAGRGWDVTALEVSGVALERASRHARDAGVSVHWVHAGLAEARLPPASFDLVSAQYPALLRTPDAAAERALLAAVAPGGLLLLVHHAGMDTQPVHDGGFDPADYVWPAMITALLDDDWNIEVDEQRPRLSPETGAGAAAHHVDDLVVRARRLR